ncbi:hypothetical protein FMZ60_08530 [Alcaligenaceae bacterium SJ-26]|nr:hypothetical protein FMZ60_08530 [Alcaligenaceae bacterium SJ-26]
MPLDSEPRNGDYASYIDALVNRQTTAPGQTARRPQTGAAKARSQFPDMPSSLPPQPAPLPTGGRPARQAAPRHERPATTPAPANQPSDTPQPTLAELATKRRGGLVMMLIGIAALIKGFDFASNVLLYQQFSELIPMFVLLFIGSQFFQRGRDLRRQGKLPG